MSVVIDLENIDFDIRKKISEDLSIKPNENNYNKNPESVLCFDLEEKDEKHLLTVPFSYYYQTLSHKNIPIYSNTTFNKTNSERFKFVGKLNRIQEEIKEETFEILNRTRSILISLYCGAGKTFFSLYLTSKLKYKTIILIHLVTLVDQWVESIEEFCPNAKVQILSTTNKIDEDCDFYIINVDSVKKRNKKDFENIGVVIADESHVFCTDNRSQSLMKFNPRYIIGLSATLDRTDGMSKILEVYFGPERITRKLYKPFNLYKLNTNIKIKTRQNVQGKLDWNNLLETQALDENRNLLIVNIVRYFKTRNFLILCKRKDQSNIIYKLLKEQNENVDLFIASTRKYNKETRVLVTSYSKSGVGFNFKKLDALILAGDVQENIEQYLFRIFRREDVSPIVFDLVDKQFTLNKHYKVREELYLSVGAKIQNFYKKFPEFNKWVELRS